MKELIKNYDSLYFSPLDGFLGGLIVSWMFDINKDANKDGNTVLFSVLIVISLVCIRFGLGEVRRRLAIGKIPDGTALISVVSICGFAICVAIMLVCLIMQPYLAATAPSYVRMTVDWSHYIAYMLIWLAVFAFYELSKEMYEKNKNKLENLDYSSTKCTRAQPGRHESG